MGTMRKLTALLIVRNEETALPACLDSLDGVVDALAVVDTGSTDGTAPLIAVEALRGRFESVRWERLPFVDFAVSRNAALNLVDEGWVLWIDADERLSPELRDELRAALESGALEDADAWTLPFRTHVLGRRMRCRELAGQRHLRLFRVEGATFRGAVHEGVVLPAGATVGELHGAVDHHTMTSWPAYLRKTRRYAALEAGRRTRRYALLHLPVAWPLTFLRQYVRRGCWRDGWAGLVWATTSGINTLLRDWERIIRDSIIRD